VSVVSINGDTKRPPRFTSEAKAAAKGTGDNAYIYLPFAGTEYIVRGTIPAGETNFKISGAINEPIPYFMSDFVKYVQSQAADPSKELKSFYQVFRSGAGEPVLFTHYSPSLDSIIYWFNKRSVNFYGEALVKTFAYEQQGFGRTDSGVSIMRRFWEQKGMDK
jgi:serine-type D-Ala-D-Ala carboxypeptidase/endopeptidase (penicillin-binding protein 4)